MRKIFSSFAMLLIGITFLSCMVGSGLAWPGTIWNSNSSGTNSGNNAGTEAIQLQGTGSYTDGPLSGGSDYPYYVPSSISYSSLTEYVKPQFFGKPTTDTTSTLITSSGGSVTPFSSYTAGEYYDNPVLRVSNSYFSQSNLPIDGGLTYASGSDGSSAPTLNSLSYVTAGSPPPNWAGDRVIGDYYGTNFHSGGEWWIDVQNTVQIETYSTFGHDSILVSHDWSISVSFAGFFYDQGPGQSIPARVKVGTS